MPDAGSYFIGVTSLPTGGTEWVCLCCVFSNFVYSSTCSSLKFVILTAETSNYCILFEEGAAGGLLNYFSYSCIFNYVCLVCCKTGEIFLSLISRESAIWSCVVNCSSSSFSTAAFAITRFCFALERGSLSLRSLSSIAFCSEVELSIN